jgi:hypothetical protein
MELIRKDRDALSTEIRRLLNQKITAAEYEDLTEHLLESVDRTVIHVSFEMIAFCDCLVDEHLELNKQQWGYIQRLLLLLDSDRHWIKRCVCRGSRVQLLALAGLALFASSWIVFGWSMQLIICTIAAGVFSISIELFREVVYHSVPNIGVLYPFHSFESLESIYAATHFTKQPFPKELYSDDHDCSNLYRTTINACAQIAAGPLTLIVQLFPSHYTDTKVVTG